MIRSGVCRLLAIVMILLSPNIVGTGAHHRWTDFKGQATHATRSDGSGDNPNVGLQRQSIRSGVEIGVDAPGVGLVVDRDQALVVAVEQVDVSPRVRHDGHEARRRRPHASAAELIPVTEESYASLMIRLRSRPERLDFQVRLASVPLGPKLAGAVAV